MSGNRFALRGASVSGALVLALQLAALWPVWQWYARVIISSDGKWGMLAALTSVAFLLWKKGGRERTTAARGETKRGRVEIKRGLWLPTLFLFLYALAYPFLPLVLSSAIALTALGSTLSLLRLGRLFHPGLMGLLYLSLPLIPSLQFYGGYPLRILVAGVTAPVLRLGGFNVIQEATCLNWGGKLIWIDAPCSGVRMLWVGLYLACALAAVYDLRPLKTLYVLMSASVVIILGNVFRAVALFYLEAGIVEMPPWGHDYVGVVAFVLIAAGITASVRWIRREKLCAPQLST